MSSKTAASVPGLLAGGLTDRAEELAAAMIASQQRKRRTHPYSGELAGPPGRTNDETVRRYRMLFEHFGLQPWDWPALAVVLAATHVPGLRLGEPAKKGRPRKLRPVQVSNLGLAGVPISASFGPGLLGSHFVAKKKGGRKKGLNENERQALLSIRTQWRAERHAIDEKATDAEFLHAFCKAHYEDWKLIPSAERKKRLLFWKNQLSRTKKVGSIP